MIPVSPGNQVLHVYEEFPVHASSRVELETETSLHGLLRGFKVQAWKMLVVDVSKRCGSGLHTHQRPRAIPADPLPILFLTSFFPVAFPF